MLHFSATSGDLTLEGLTVTGGRTTGDNVIFNDTTYGGGGVRFDSDGRLTLTDSTVSGNTSSGSHADGGGIFTRTGDVTLTSSTVSGNMAGGAVGGVYVFDSNSSPSFTLHNSIIAGNTDNGTAPDLQPNPDSTLTVDYSLIGSTDLTISGAGNQFGTLADPINPLLGPLADNGGPTQTHALLPGSPALDAGDPSITPLTDQRGFARNMGSIDIGAYEAQIVPSADFDTDGDVDGSDFLAWQRGFGTENAQLADGNNDDDTDADASDLAAWQVSFAQPQPLAATIVSDQPTAVSSQPTDGAAGASAELPVQAELIDAAIALATTESSFSESSEYFPEPTAFAAVLATGSEVDAPLPPTGLEAEQDLPASAAGEQSATSDPWLDEELLAAVFG